MARLETTSSNDLRNELEAIDGGREVRRLVAALLYLHGHTGPAIAELFGVREATVYSWLDRFEQADDVADAVTDRPRPGRPPRLGPDERGELLDVLARSPDSVGVEADTWTPETARDYLVDEYGVEYSLRHVRRLLDEAE